MSATKYVPKHFAGVLVKDVATVVFSPGAGVPVPLGEVLTGIVAVNGANAVREFSLYYTNNSTSIYLFKQLLLPAHSTTNLDLYLPLVAGQNLSALASAPNDVSLTLYGLRLVEI
jgi:hypothetical protein